MMNDDCWREDLTAPLLKYGDQTIPCTLPQTKVLNPPAPGRLQDPHAAVRAALAAPLGAPRLKGIVAPGSDADIVISSTASQLPILGKGAVESALKARKHRPMFMLDIAVPRDIESEVAELDDVYLYTIDDLKEVVQENMESREAAARDAEKIIDTKVVDFMQWVTSLDAVPAIRALRESANALREAEVERARRRLAHGEDPALVIEHLARALTNKFTHTPTDVLRRADHEGNKALLEAARRLFNLDEE